MSARDQGRRFLSWLGSRLAADCRHDVERGLHWEQRWLDLAPSYFEEVVVDRDPGANVGHWNLHQRRLDDDGERITVDGAPARIVRFSGYDPARPDEVTRHLPGWRVDELGTGAARLFRRYQDELEAGGWRRARRLPYGYARFADGVPIPDVARWIYAGLGDDVARFGDPFGVGPGSFRAWLAGPADPPGSGVPTAAPVSRLWLGIHRQRADLAAAFPDPLGADREAFLAWTRSSGAREHALDPRLAWPGAETA